MNPFLTTIILFTNLISFAQNISDSIKNRENIVVPSGIIYKYCSPSVIEKSKSLINQSISNPNESTLLSTILYVGPNLWSRIHSNPKISSIEGGNVTINIGNETRKGKMTQDLNDSKKIFEVIKEEVKSEKYILRKAKVNELTYYWSVISFDIEEPLIILETSKHKYILNISPKTQKLIWLDEAL